jgi:hypothetical protein
VVFVTECLKNIFTRTVISNVNLKMGKKLNCSVKNKEIIDFSTLVTEYFKNMFNG